MKRLDLLLEYLIHTIALRCCPMSQDYTSSVHSLVLDIVGIHGGHLLMYRLFDVQGMHVVCSHVKYTCFSVRENKNINKTKKVLATRISVAIMNHIFN